MAVINKDITIGYFKDDIQTVKEYRLKLHNLSYEQMTL